MAQPFQPRPKSFDGKFGDDAIICAVRDYLKQFRVTLFHPLTVAKAVGCTRSEARLALRILRDWKLIGHRESDGRWYYDTNEPWRTA